MWLMSTAGEIPGERKSFLVNFSHFSLFFTLLLSLFFHIVLLWTIKSSMPVKNFSVEPPGMIVLAPLTSQPLRYRAKIEKPLLPEVKIKNISDRPLVTKEQEFQHKLSVKDNLKTGDKQKLSLFVLRLPRSFMALKIFPRKYKADFLISIDKNKKINIQLIKLTTIQNELFYLDKLVYRELKNQLIAMTQEKLREFVLSLKTSSIKQKHFMETGLQEHEAEIPIEIVCQK